MIAAIEQGNFKFIKWYRNLSVEVRAAHEIIAARAAELAFLIVQFVAALKAITPVFARIIRNGDGAFAGLVLFPFRRVVHYFSRFDRHPITDAGFGDEQ